MRLRDRLLSWFAEPDPDGRRFDETWGTETRRYDLGNYEPTPVGVAEEVLDRLPADPDRTLVDLGSGKGRVVLLASRRTFRRVVGIERRPALHAVAERNRSAFWAAGGARSPIHLLCVDVARHPLPEGPLVLWLFNPFGPEVVLPLLKRVAGRDLVVVYVTPTHEALLRGWDADSLVIAGRRPLAEIRAAHVET